MHDPKFIQGFLEIGIPMSCADIHGAFLGSQGECQFVVC